LIDVLTNVITLAYDVGMDETKEIDDLRAEVDRLEVGRAQWRERAEAAEAALAEERAQTARVEAELDRHRTLGDLLRSIRAALAGPAPEATE
jgi:hypothetical protein